MQLAQVVHGSVEQPLAAAAAESAHAEPAGALAVLHLAEHRLDRGPALAVAGAPALGAQLALHALSFMFLGLRPRGGDASRRAARCAWSFWVAMNSSHVSVSVAALASDQ